MVLFYRKLKARAAQLEAENAGLRAKLEEITKYRQSIDAWVDVMRDLNRAGDGYLEVRRVDPDRVFVWSPK